MGARSGYLFLAMVPCFGFGMLHGAALLQSFLPIEAGIGFLMWIGLQITAAAFEGDDTPQGWRHGPAIALGLLPSISAWSWSRIERVFEATRGVICADLLPQLAQLQKEGGGGGEGGEGPRLGASHERTLGLGLGIGLR